MFQRYISVYKIVHTLDVGFSICPIGVIDSVNLKSGIIDLLCGLVVRVSGSRSRGLRFDSWPYQIL
jgi:hypothetical protein